MKTKDEVTQTARPLTQRKTLYSPVVAQVTLRSLHELFKADRMGQVDIIVFNGYVAAPIKGQVVLSAHVWLRYGASRDTFTQLNLSKVDPLACARRVECLSIESLAELAPVRPVLEFNMVDPRFIEETDVLSGLISVLTSWT